MPDKPDSENPKEWMIRAFSNLNLAKTHQEGVCLEDLCFNAQQAVEKAIKALLIKDGVKFPYTHNIAELLTLLQKSGYDLPDFAKQSASLTTFAVLRYPGITRHVKYEDYEQAIVIAEKVVNWAKSIIG